MLVYGILLLSAAAAGLVWFYEFGILAAALTFVGSVAALALPAFLFLWAACALVDISKPQEHDSKFYRVLTNLIIEAVMMVARVRVHTSGLEKTPKEGRFLLVCNHLNDSDPALLLRFFRKSQLAFISKKENSTMFIVGKVMHKILCQMINRENDREALKTILKCIQLIKDDEVSVAVFPEGGIKGNNLLNPFRPGVFKIAQKANVPIVVCTLWGSQDVFKNLAKLKPTDVDLHLVGVIPAEELKGVTAVDISNRVRAMMAADLGEERVYQEQNT